MLTRILDGISTKLKMIILLSLINLIAFAQGEVDLRLQPKPSGTLYQKSTAYTGSEFLFDNWQTGELILVNGQKLSKLRVNYNAFSDDVVYALKENSAVVVSKYQLLGFKIFNDSNERVFVLSNSSRALDKYLEPATFLEVIYDGTNKVYAHRALRINNLLVNDNPFNKSVYYTDTKYYVSIMDVVINSPQNKKSYFDYFEKSIIKEIIRSNKLSLKNEEDLVFFISHLDKLEIITETQDE